MQRQRKIYAFLFFFFLLGCTSTPNQISEEKFSSFKVIELNIFDYNLIINEKKYLLTDELGFESNYLLERLNSWGNEKFKVVGKKFSLFLNIENFSLKKKNIKKNEGLKKIFLSEEEIEYNLNLKISLKFFNKTNNLDTISIDGNINFLIKDNYTILQKKRQLSIAYIELIRKIDEAVDKELKKEIFSNYLPIK